MYKELVTYKEFIKEKEFNGTLGSLIEEIVKDFVNQEIVQSKFGEFYNIAGSVMLEKYGDFGFNEEIDTGLDGELDMDGVLEEEIIKKVVTRHFLYRAKYKYRELDIDNQIEAMSKLLGSNIKATYTLSYS